MVGIKDNQIKYRVPDGLVLAIQIGMVESMILDQRTMLMMNFPNTNVNASRLHIGLSIACVKKE